MEIAKEIRKERKPIEVGEKPEMASLSNVVTRCSLQVNSGWTVPSRSKEGKDCDMSKECTTYVHGI